MKLIGCCAVRQLVDSVSPALLTLRGSADARWPVIWFLCVLEEWHCRVFSFFGFHRNAIFSVVLFLFIHRPDGAAYDEAQLCWTGSDRNGAGFMQVLTADEVVDNLKDHTMNTSGRMDEESFVVDQLQFGGLQIDLSSNTTTTAAATAECS